MVLKGLHHFTWLTALLFVLGLSQIAGAAKQEKTPQKSLSQADFAPWQSGLEQRFWLKVHDLCPNSPEFVARAQDLKFRAALDHKHSYLRSATYLGLRRWTREFKPLQRYLSQAAHRTYSFAETTLCIAAANHDKKWAMLDSALLLDGHIYEAMERGRDPLNVLSVAALEIRQDLYNLAMANYLHQLLRRHQHYSKTKQLTKTAISADNVLGASALHLHKTLLFFESLTTGPEQVAPTNFSVDVLQPRLADQPLYADLSLHTASREKLFLAQQIFCSFDAHNCKDLGLNQVPDLLFTPEQVEHGQQSLDELLQDTKLCPLDFLYVFGGLASNRFHGLYELAPALIDRQDFDIVGPLFFFGAAIHFQMQLADARSYAHQSRFFTIHPKAAPDYPSLKTYHFWSEALLGCLHAKAGYSQKQSTLDAKIIGSHYRYLMTPAYLAYRIYLGEKPWAVLAANQQAVKMHVQGAAFGYKLCAEQL